MVNTPDTQQVHQFTIDPATTVGWVTLGVADLEMMTRYYEQVIGLTLLRGDETSSELGVDGQPIVRLEARPHGRRYPNAPGLYHLAILVPTRADLGQWLRHYISTQNRMIDGAGDHFVSEALYLSDPEGNGLEIYRDRPRDTWEFRNGELVMGTAAVDLPAVVAAAHDAPFTGMPSGTTLGHVHLQVRDVAEAVRFYGDVLGFDYMVGFASAGFMSAGGYHHHLGMNTWHSRRADPAPAGSLGLINYSIVLPTQAARDALLAHLNRLNIPLEQVGDDPVVRDPSGSAVILTVSG